MRKRKSNKVIWNKAPDVKKDIKKLKSSLDLNWLNTSRIYCFRSNNSSSRAYARVWGLSKIWQLAIGIKASYIIEVLSEKYDKLNKKEQYRILLHEITHIPKNFSGSLLPHIRKRGKRNFNSKVDELFNIYLNNIYKKM